MKNTLQSNQRNLKLLWKTKIFITVIPTFLLQMSFCACAWRTDEMLDFMWEISILLYTQIHQNSLFYPLLEISGTYLSMQVNVMIQRI